MTVAVWPLYAFGVGCMAGGPEWDGHPALTWHRAACAMLWPLLLPFAAARLVAGRFDD